MFKTFLLDGVPDLFLGLDNFKSYLWILCKLFITLIVQVPFFVVVDCGVSQPFV